VTTMCLPQSLFNVMVDDFLDAFATVRQVIVGGDAASTHHLGVVRRAHPDLRLVNGYGPVESMIVTTCHVIGDDRTAGSAVPIGRPDATTRGYGLDTRLCPVPAWGA